MLCIQHQSSSSHSFQLEAKPPVQLVPAAAWWTAPKSKRGAGFIHTSKHRDIRQILTVKHHHGFCAGELLKIGCHQDLGRGYKQISSFISQELDKMKLHAKRKNVTYFRWRFEAQMWGERSFFVLSSGFRQQVSALFTNCHLAHCSSRNRYPTSAFPAFCEGTKELF